MQDERMQPGMWRVMRRAAVPTLVVSLLGGVVWAASESAQYRVSQKDREFHPGKLEIKRGDVVEIVNDDGDLLHHAYVESKAFSFDSSDQEPGAKVDITFPVAGTFTVLCGIHPKMRLRVQVNEGAN